MEEFFGREIEKNVLRFAGNAFLEIGQGHRCGEWGRAVLGGLRREGCGWWIFRAFGRGGIEREGRDRLHIPQANDVGEGWVLKESGLWCYF
jgi:hypothetical protein